MFLEVLSLQIIFTVCFLKFILSCILHLGQNELHNASTPWELLPSHHIASSMNIVKVRDIPEKVEHRIRTGVNFFIYDWNDLFLYDWNNLFLRTGAWGRENGERERGETEHGEQEHVGSSMSTGACGREPWGREPWGRKSWGREPWGREPWGQEPWGRELSGLHSFLLGTASDYLFQILFSDYIVFCWARRVIICFVVCFRTTYFFYWERRVIICFVVCFCNT